MYRSIGLACILAGLAASATASVDGEYRFGRLRFVDPSVALQRAAESDADEAVANAPFVPGDRVWSDRTGRAEFQLFDGTLLWLDTRSKLDYTANETDAGRDRIVLRLWSGALLVRSSAQGQAALDLETPDATVQLDGDALVRVDAGQGVTRVTVREGAAEVVYDRGRTRLGQGERTEVRQGEAAEDAWRAGAGQEDDFAAWVDARDPRAPADADSGRYLPEGLAPYAADLESHGTWYYESDLGYVWRPRVDLSWEPYSNGRWIWTAFGWTWVPYESWGWAPFHYGRWGRSLRLGWYWIPDRAFGPAWVSWAIGPHHVGWCALDRWNRPLRHHVGVGPGHRGRGRDPWVFVRRGDFTARDLRHRRGADMGPHSAGLTYFASDSRRPARNLDATLDARVRQPLPLARSEAFRRRPEGRRSGIAFQSRRDTDAGSYFSRRHSAERSRVREDTGAVSRDTQSSDRFHARPRNESQQPPRTRWLWGGDRSRPTEQAPSRMRREGDAEREQRRERNRGVMGHIFGRLGDERREGSRSHASSESSRRSSDDSRGSSGRSHASSNESRGSSHSGRGSSDSGRRSSGSGGDRHPSRRHR